MNEGDPLPPEWVSPATKLEALSRFHSGISHDLNNRLTTLLGYISVLEELLPGEEEMLSDMRHAASEATELVRLIQTFRTRDPLPLAPVELGRFLQRLQDLLGRLFDQHQPLPCLIPDEDLYLLAEEGALEQILLSLLGESLAGPAPSLRLTADRHILRMEFLGLAPVPLHAVTLNLIQALGGDFVDTDAARVLSFPRCHPELPPALPPPDPVSGDTLLLAERDPQVRKSLLEVLTRAGYQVRTADDVKTCGEYCAADSFDLAVLDTRLSGGGQTALTALPGLPARRIWMEPYAGADPRTDGLCIAKPFRPVDLLRVLNG